MANKNDFSVGQTIWHTASWGRSSALNEGKITKVGRKYVTVDGQYHFFIDSCQENRDWGSPGALYLNKEDYEQERQLNIISD